MICIVSIFPVLAYNAIGSQARWKRRRSNDGKELTLDVEIMEVDMSGRRLMILFVIVVVIGMPGLLTAQQQWSPPGNKDLASINSRIEALAPEMIRMADWMYQNPEPGHQETKSAAMLTDFLKKNGFSKIEMNAGGFPTAFKASFDGNNGAPHLAFMVEYDALRGKEGSAFHGCQHNLQGPSGIGAAIALAEFMKSHNLPGSVYVIGTPAEEIAPPVKRIMYERGAFTGLDFITRSHGGQETKEPDAGIGGCCNVPINEIHYIFHGKATNANVQVGKMPLIKDRHSALEGLLEFFKSVEVIRGIVRPETIIQGIIVEGGEATNVFPERASADFSIRYDGKREYLETVTEMMTKAAQQAAKVTGTEAEIDIYGKYEKGISLSTLHHRAFEYAKAYGATNVKTEKAAPSGYDETGIVAANIPGVGITVQSAPEGISWHSHEVADASIQEIGHKGMMIHAKVMASVMFDLLTDANYRQQVRAEFDKWHQVWLSEQGKP
jgi:amidohydrolase